MNRQDIVTSIAFSLINILNEQTKSDIMVCGNKDLFKYHFTIGVMIRRDYLPQFNWVGETDEIVHDILLEISNILRSCVL